MEWVIEIKVHGARIFALVVIVALIIASSLILIPQILKTSNNELIDTDTYFPPTPRLPRGTRAGNSWPMHRADLLHSGFSTSSVPDNNSILWTNTTGNGDAYGSPVVEDGKVFVGSRDGYLYCFDLNTGERLWRTFLSSGDYSISSTPAVANNHVVIFSAGDDAVYRLKVSDGGINWSFNPTGGGAYGGSSPAINNGRIYVGSGNGTFYCLNEITGNIIWSYTTGIGPVRPYGIQSSPAVANGRIFIGSCDTYLYCINETQPGPVADYFWRTNLFDAIFGSAAVANGRVYCGSGYYNYGEGTGSHTMFCLNELTGEVIWSYQTGSDILSSPAIAYGNCYFTSADGNLYCVDALSGGPIPTLYWSNTTGDTWSSPAVSDGKVVVGSRGTDTIYCYNATTGTLVWSYFAGNDVYSSPAIGEGKVVVGVRGNPEKVVCFGSSVVPTLDYIIIRTAPNGGGSWVGDSTYLLGETDTFYAAGYNDSAGWIEDVLALWYSDNTSIGNVAPGPSYSTIFDALNHGTCNITADYGGFLNTTGMLTIFNYAILKQGWNLISIPLIQEDQSLSKVLESIGGYYDAVQWYDITDRNDAWKHFKEGKPYGNDLSKINETMGFWIHITQPGDTIFIYNGTQPTVNRTIALHKGWNQVGYPSQRNRNTTEALNNIDFDTEVEAIWTYNATTQKWKELSKPDYFEKGSGYWIYSLVEETWDVPL